MLLILHVHSPIEISLKQTDQEVSTKCSDDTRTNEQKINNWTNEKSYKFLECLNLTEIENINSEIDGTTVVTQETVDMIISKIGKVLINSAGNTFGFKVSAGKKSEHRKNKPWFDHDCKAARSEFRKMKRNKNKSPFHRALVSDAEKRYKNTMNKAHKKYRSDFRKKMDDLKQKDAKEFWRLLNENKSTAQPKIDFDKLVSYFKELNSDLRDDTEEQQIEKRVVTPTPNDCSDLSLGTCSGVYIIRLQNSVNLTVFCDMETDNGGWTVIQTRFDGAVNFSRDWSDYKTGFGEIAGEHWLGDSMRDHFDNSLNGMKFTTHDNDNDIHDYNCGIVKKSGWWHATCTYSNINGIYKEEVSEDSNYWLTFGGKKGLRKTKMMMKPNLEI
ncbi:unnamed protein product [Mytilus edulis]|uniref:Fibrinogen C-terminal domain-containing protein n=1 Tax=Mytilus edulis TaxID=6550 RepID=A0A8S3QMS7_MYTED|nr:unnamed protein product [Mytilus edulis]